MKKIILFIALMTMTLSFAQSKQVDKILDTSKDGVSTVYNDGKQAVTTVYNDVKSLSPKVESALSNLATSLKTTADSVWFIIVRQQIVWSWCFLILTLSSIGNWIMFYRRLYPNVKDVEFTILERDITGDVLNPAYDDYYAKNYPDSIKSQMYIKGVAGKENYNAPKIIEQSNSQKGVNAIHLIICITLSVFSFYHFSDMMTGFLNPQFGALKTIVEVAQNLK